MGKFTKKIHRNQSTNTPNTNGLEITRNAKNHRKQGRRGKFLGQNVLNIG